MEKNWYKFDSCQPNNLEKTPTLSKEEVESAEKRMKEIYSTVLKILDPLTPKEQNHMLEALRETILDQRAENIKHLTNKIDWLKKAYEDMKTI